MKKDTKREMIDFSPVFLLGGLFVIIHSLALLVIQPFEDTGMVAFENPNDPMNVVYFFLVMVLFTVAILVIAKFWRKQLIQAIFLGATSVTSFYVFYPLLSSIIPWIWSFFLSITSVAILVLLLVKYPEWYVIDICGVVLGVGSIAIFGISLSILLAIVLLIGLAVYDAISVYKTKHMIDLADTVLDLKLPAILIVPKIRNYSLLTETQSLKEKLEAKEEREAFFMGLGDVVVPGILVVSTFYNVPGNGLRIALCVMLGTLIGFVLLLRAISNGKPQAGLPYLCSGAILGYVISSYIMFGELVGLTSPI